MEFSSFKTKFTTVLSEPKTVNSGTIHVLFNVQELIIFDIEKQETINTGKFYNVEGIIDSDDLLKEAYNYLYPNNTSL
jgi:hypothetical protein